MQYIIFSLLTLALLVVYLKDKFTFLNIILMLGSMPFVLLMPTLIIGRVNGQAALLLILFLLLIVSSISSFHKFLLVVKKFYFSFLFVLLSLISIVWTNSISECLGMTVKYITPILLVVLILSVIRSNKDIIKCEKSIIICGVILITLGIINKLIGEPFDSASKWKGSLVLLAPYMSPANYSFMLSMSALLSFSNFLQRRKKIWFVLFAVFFVGVMFAFTRISMAALLFASMMLYGLSKRSVVITYLAPISALIVAVLSVVFIEPLRDRMFFKNVDLSLMVTNFSKFLQYVNTSGRTTIWSDAFAYFKNANVFIGAGSGSTDHYMKTLTNAVALHCDFLRVYFDLGLIGLILFLLVHFQLLKVVSSRPRNSQNTKIHNKYKNLSIAALIFYFITLFTDNTLNYVANIGMYLYAFIGFSLYVGLSKKDLFHQETTIKIHKK